MAEIEAWFKNLSVAELAGVAAGAAVFAIIVIVCCCYCFLKRNSYKPDEADMVMAETYQAQNPKFAGFGRQASAGTFARNIGAKPSASVKSQFGRRKKQRGQRVQQQEQQAIDESSIKPVSAPGGPQFSQNVMQNLQKKQAGKAPPKKVSQSRANQGKSYGRLDPEAQERIRSVRLQAADLKLKPIVPGGAPSAKALKMMGITEEEATQQYHGSVTDRMKRLAASAGGGAYAPGFTTAKFVTDGFANWKDKLDQRKKQKEERAALQKQMEEKRKTLDTKMKPIRPKAENAPPKPKPKPKGINAFLAEQAAHKEEDDEEEDRDDDDSEHIDNDI